ncbi:glycosyl transferase family 90 [Mucilaginibacter xinganensis]|uniref:Glycosyl transferase family 90 n=1 Tax=Mucilaginibacter xinganensis TaxID=1234841 RepID=A0A223NZF3_9SPHI|nr:glycosyl transferase family 90 [Mucilaginibacter xinganensis]ASU35269.1 Glycosyl transferase family 90 [Mucilaginibacter xinganensis]
MVFKKIVEEIKRNKAVYYSKNILRQIIPTIFYQRSLNKKLLLIGRYDSNTVHDRVNYYNKLKQPTPIGDNATVLKEMQIFKSPKTYNFDAFEYLRYFKGSLRANFLFGDITHIANVPSLQKSRPIAGDNSNAVLLKLDKKRHFFFVKDKKLYSDKKNMLIGRGTIYQPHREKFMEMYFDNPLCDLGQVNKKGGNLKWLKPPISIDQHLQYKFILSLEGNDVATNLKWIMSSNSIAVMPKPKYETWFMEGRLIPGFHYIEIKDDYTDLIEKLNYYAGHIDEAEQIISNAKAFVTQFLDQQQEAVISLLVLQKYFAKTMQQV